MTTKAKAAAEDKAVNDGPQQEQDAPSNGAVGMSQTSDTAADKPQGVVGNADAAVDEDGNTGINDDVLAHLSDPEKDVAADPENADRYGVPAGGYSYVLDPNVKTDNSPKGGFNEVMPEDVPLEGLHSGYPTEATKELNPITGPSEPTGPAVAHNLPKDTGPTPTPA